MLYILGGASRSGKSKVAQELLKQEEVSHFSLDYLKMGFHKGLADFGINANQPSHVVAEKMWSFAKGVLETIIEAGDSHLIEGDSIYPKQANELLQNPKYKDQVRVCFLGYPESTPEQKLKEIREFSGGINDWIQDKSDEYILNFAKGQIDLSKRLEDECVSLDIRFIDVSKDFDNQVQEAIKYLLR